VAGWWQPPPDIHQVQARERINLELLGQDRLETFRMLGKRIIRATFMPSEQAAQQNDMTIRASIAVDFPSIVRPRVHSGGHRTRTTRTTRSSTPARTRTQ
jgi:hypothetical protein